MLNKGKVARESMLIKKKLKLTDEIIRTSRLPSSMAALHNAPRHSRESGFGFLGKKKKRKKKIKTPGGAYVP